MNLRTDIIYYFISVLFIFKNKSTRIMGTAIVDDDEVFLVFE